MSRQSNSLFSRRLLIASIVFGVLVLCDILLFGFLIFRSLSQREIDRVLLETRAEAQDLARRIADQAGGEESGLYGEESDLYIVMLHQKEVERYIGTELVQRDLVEKVEILNDDGSLVYRWTRGPEPGLEPGEAPLQVPDEGDLSLGKGELEISEAIGDLGILRIGLSPAELQQRTAVLRRDLIQQMVWILLVSLAVLLSAYAIIWLLLLRARRLAEQAEEADRLAYIGTLAAGLAHEIRNPLNSLNLNMQMLEEEVAAGCEIPSGRRLLSITRQEITRLERLVTDFLLYARPRPLELEELAPGELLGRVREILAGEARSRGVRLRLEDRCPAATVKADRAQMTQLLLNLAQNAIAATEESPRRPEVTLSAELVGARVVLAVEDNGRGIAAEERERIFEVFYSTRKGGTGLGLAVVERIARAHGGEVEVDSEPGRGTRVALALPVATLRQELPPLETEARVAVGSQV